MRPLKQSTSVSVRVGPFLDVTDGDTEETGLSIATTDVRLSKDGAAYAAQDAGATAPSHDENGHYVINLTATDTDTLGELILYIHVSGALYMRETFTVLPANVYDSLIGGADKLQTDATEISGDSAAADSLEANIGNLDAAVSSRSSHGDPDPNGHIDADISSRMEATASERQAIADALLARNVGGGSSSGRLVKEALAALRNRVALDRSGGSFTVYDTDDSTPLFSGTITTAEGEPVSDFDPS